MDIESPSGWAGTWEDQCAYIICVYTIVIMCLFSFSFFIESDSYIYMAIWVNVKGGRTPCTKERQQCMVRELHHLKHDGPLFVHRCGLILYPYMVLVSMV